jgi:hypothetical protein
MGISIKADAADIGIPESDFSILNRSIPVPDSFPFFREYTGSGISILFHSGTGLTG